MSWHFDRRRNLLEQKCWNLCLLSRCADLSPKVSQEQYYSSLLFLTACSWFTYGVCPQDHERYFVTSAAVDFFPALFIHERCNIPSHLSLSCRQISRRRLDWLAPIPPPEKVCLCPLTHFNIRVRSCDSTLRQLVRPDINVEIYWYDGERPVLGYTNRPHTCSVSPPPAVYMHAASPLSLCPQFSTTVQDVLQVSNDVCFIPSPILWKEISAIYTCIVFT